MAVELSTNTNSKKRGRDEDEDILSPGSTVDIKRQRLDTGPGESRFGAIASAISGVFGYNRATPESNGNTPEPPAPANGGYVPPNFHAVTGQSQAPAQAPAPIEAPAPGAINAAPPAAAPRPSLGRIEIRLPTSASAPAVSRPAIKLSALKGSKWDAGGTGIKGGAKKKPGRPPAKAIPPRETLSPLKPIASIPEYHAEKENKVGFHSPVASPSKPRPFAVTPRGILSPTKRAGIRSSKSVKFDRNGEVFFDDIPKSPAFRSPAKRRNQEEEEEEDSISCGVCAKPHSKPPNQIILCDNCDYAVHQECYDVKEIPEGDWLCKSCVQDEAVKAKEEPDANMTAIEVKTIDRPDIPNLDTHLRSLQRILLDRCSGRRRIQMFGQDEAAEKVRQLLEQTVLAGEGNSMMLIGPRGSGKTTMVENTITALSQQHKHEFHTVRLNGFIHTDDKLALKDIWRQLGKEMEVEDDLLNRSNYADTMASLLALLSHPEEISALNEGMTSASVLFVIDEFDLFATHPRQTLLYNLFDIAQSRKAPIAVLGCTTRLDVVEMLEKRVKSRFSHRYVYLSPPKTLLAYWQVCRQGLMLGDVDPENEGMDTTLEGYGEFIRYWNRKIEELYKQRSFQDLLQYHYYTSKSAATFFTEWVLPLSRVTSKDLKLVIPAAGGDLTSLAPPDSRMDLLASLSELDLSLLIAAARLDIIAHTDTVNFAMAYDEYSGIVGRQRVQSATSGLMAVGGTVRVWSRGVASMAWERLISLGLLVPSGIGGGSRRAGGLEGRMWKVDVALEEIPAGVKLSAIMAKWCREI